MLELNTKLFKALELRELFQQIYAATTAQEFEDLLSQSIFQLRNKHLYWNHTIILFCIGEDCQWYFWATHSKIEPMQQVAKIIKKH